MIESLVLEEILNDIYSPELISLYVSMSDLFLSARYDEHIEKLNLYKMLLEGGAYSDAVSSETVEGILRESAEYILTAHGITIDDNIPFKYLYNIVFAVLTFDGDDLLSSAEDIVMSNDGSDEMFARFVELRTSVDSSEFYIYIKEVTDQFIDNLISAIRVFNEGLELERAELDRIAAIRKYNKEHKDAVSNEFLKEGVSLSVSSENLYNINRYRIRKDIAGGVEDIMSICTYANVPAESMRDEMIYFFDDWFNDPNDHFMAVKRLNEVLNNASS